MSQTANVLINFKKNLNFKTLKDFHSYLLKRGFTANYQHFAKILKGQVPASADIVEQISSALPAVSDEITLAFCQDMFPQKAYLFQIHLPPKEEPSEVVENSESDDLRQVVGKVKASVLNGLQIACLGQRKENYFLFLVCTMARKPILKEELKYLMSEEALKSSIEELTQAGVIIKTKAGYQTFNTEIKFPPKSELNIKLYRKLDQWDLEFSSSMQMNSLVSKVMLRRISPRYLGLINGQIQLLIESLRISDESETKYNSEVVQLSISLFQGKLPG